MSIRDDFFANQAVAALWDVAVSIKRGNPLPLDSNSVFKSYADLETYASGVLAYPGQIVAVVNADSTEIYYLDQELAIKPVGSVPTADNKSIQVVDGILSLYNYGTSYYKYIKEIKDSEGNVTSPARYEKVEVSTDNPWISGLEPRVIDEDGELVIGWFEPNPTTIEGVQAQISDLQQTVEGIAGEIGAPAKDDLNPATGLYAELDKKANKDSVYTKTETDNLIASVDHLKRKIFESKALAQAFVDENLETADRYIYMVPSGLELDSNRYYEYMVIEGALEQVGNWEVDLNDYFTEDELKTYLEDYYTEEEVTAILADYAQKTDLEGYYNVEQIDNLLTNYYTSEQVNKLLEKYVLCEDGKSLVDDSEIEKLKTVQENAEPNYIKSVTSDFKVTENGQLSLESVAIAKVLDLQETLDNKVSRAYSLNEDGSKTEWTLLSPSDKQKLDSLVITESGLEISGTVNAANVKQLDEWIVNHRNDVLGLYPTADAEKLNGIEAGAQKNFITSVDVGVFTVTNGHLAMVDKLPANRVEGLTELQNTVNAFSTNYVSVATFNNKVGTLENTISDMSKDILELDERMTWQELAE